MCWKDLYFNEALCRACKSNGCTNVFMIWAVSLSVFCLVVAIVLFHSVYCLCRSLHMLLMLNISGAQFKLSLSCTKTKASSKQRQFCKVVRAHTCPLCTPVQLQHTSFHLLSITIYLMKGHLWVFGLWEEAGRPGGDPCRHRVDMPIWLHTGPESRYYPLHHYHTILCCKPVFCICQVVLLNPISGIFYFVVRF